MAPDGIGFRLTPVAAVSQGQIPPPLSIRVAVTISGLRQGSMQKKSFSKALPGNRIGWVLWGERAELLGRAEEVSAAGKGTETILLARREHFSGSGSVPVGRKTTPRPGRR